MDNRSKMGGTHDQNRNMIYQVSLLQSLAYGDYDGSITVKELKRHGDTGIGTFNKLNGELIMLDGNVYRAAGSGSVETVSDDETVPFSVVAYMDPGETRKISEIADYNALCNELNKVVEEKGANRFHMIRIDGMFRKVNVRSVHAQEEPYKRLTEVMEHDQTFFDHENTEGTLIGLYCPHYMAGLNAAGWHMHYISWDKTEGGHVLGVNIADAVVNWKCADGFQIRLPQNERFDRFDFTVDQSEDIKMIETNKHD